MKKLFGYFLYACVLAFTAFFYHDAFTQTPQQRPAPEQAKLGEQPFVGLTAKGEIEKGLFKLKATGVSTKPVKVAAQMWLNSLNSEQRQRARYAIDDLEWRKWDNRHFATRQGVGFNEMNQAQRDAAIGLLRASLSAKGLKLAEDVMKLNGTLAELTNNFKEYSENFYWITVMGEPDDKAPWGWQLEGHHCIINYFVLGDQVVMTPAFMGSEPIRAESGKFKGTVILQTEQDKGFKFFAAFTAEQQAKATINPKKDKNFNLTEAYKDNVVLDYAGIPAAQLNAAQKKQLLDLINEYVGNLRPGHAKVRMAEVQQHLDQTWFAWIGGADPNGVFYYRIHSPVLLIEFDHQRPIALARTPEPTRNHIHTVVRTPNGNDYGKDLLRQHLAMHQH
jgi:hypothetical protein